MLTYVYRYRKRQARIKKQAQRLEDLEMGSRGTLLVLVLEG